MDGEVFGPYSFEAVSSLGILPDTLICTDQADSSWKAATLYPEFSSLFDSQDDEENASGALNPTFGQRQTSFSTSCIPAEEDDIETEEDDSHFTPHFSHNDELLLKYKQKRKAALIGVLTLGLAGLSVVGIGETWRNNLFRGTSMDKGGVGFVLKILSFCLLSVLIAIPVFIISFIQLIYYSIKISSLSR